MLGGFDMADSTTCASFAEKLSIVRSLSPEQRQTHDAIAAELEGEQGLARCDQASGRPDEALRHARQAVAIGERWVRSGPDLQRSYRGIVSAAWRDLALLELSLGHDKEALEAARQVSVTLEPSLRVNPRLRFSVGTMSSGLLIEAMVALAARAAERGVAARRPSRRAPGKTGSSDVI